MTGIIPNQVNTLATGSTSTAPLITQFFSRPPTVNDIGSWKIGQRWIDTSVNPIVEYILQNLVAANGVITANWVQLGSTDLDIRTLTGDSGGAVSPTDGNINILGTAGQIDVTGDPGTSTLTLSLPGGGSAVDSFEPDTGTNPVVPDANGLVSIKGQNPASVSGIRVTGGTNELDIAMFSPFVGDFAFTSPTSGDTETLTISNSSDTADSQAQQLISVAGSTAGDAFTTYTVSGTQSWSIGIDNSDSDNFKISASSALGTTDWLTIATPGNAVFSGGALSVETDLIGDVVQLEVVNDDDTNTSSSARLNILVEDTGGDPYILYSTDSSGLGTGKSFEVGMDNTDESYVISYDNDATTPTLTGTIAFKIEQGGNTTLGASSTNAITLNNTTQTTVGAAGGASALPATPLGYLTITINGVAVAIPYYTPS